MQLSSYDINVVKITVFMRNFVYSRAHNFSMLETYATALRFAKIMREQIFQTLLLYKVLVRSKNVQTIC